MILRTSSRPRIALSCLASKLASLTLAVLLASRGLNPPLARSQISFLCSQAGFRRTLLVKEGDKLRFGVLSSPPIHFSDHSLFISHLYGKRDGP